jgi:polar amino acid transport system substrate-binding protein
LEVTEKAPEDIEIKRFEDNSVTVSALLANQVDLIATGNTIAGKVMQDNPDAGIANKFVMKNSPCYIGGSPGRPRHAGVGQCIRAAQAVFRRLRSPLSRVVW